MSLGTPSAAVVLCACQAFGQAASQAAPPRPVFDVASIRLHKSEDLRTRIDARGGRLNALNVPLKPILSMAFGIKDFQLVGAPAWFTMDRYDIEAKAEGNSTPEAMMLMVQALFEDRMQLKFHRETKEMPVYALVVSKSGKMHEAEGDCKPAANLKLGDPPPVPCGTVRITANGLAGRSVPVARFAEMLSRTTDRMVVDKTNLTGKYDIHLEYTRDQVRFPAPDEATDPSGPALFTALQEQLGLKLESQKAPVDVVVIDHVERPSEN